MALLGSSIFDVRSTGSDSNGGAFATLTTSMAVDLATTTGTSATPTVTSASYSFIARDEGHWLFIGAGTNWIQGWYQITSTSGGAATLSAAVGAGYLNDLGVPYAVTTAQGCCTQATPGGNGTWSIDYSQGTAISFTDLVIDGTTNTDMTSAAQPMGVNFIGNIFNVTSGTGFTVQRVQVLSIPSGVIARVDKSLGTLSSTGGVATFGGPLATPGLAGGLKVTNSSVFIQAGTYTCSNSSNVAGGRITDSTGGSPATPAFWTGWNTHRHILNTDSTKPVLNASANSVILMTLSSTGGTWVRNIKTGKSASETGTTGFSISGGNNYVLDCTAAANATGFTTASVNAVFAFCFSDTCTTLGFQGNSGIGGAGKFFACVSKGSSGFVDAAGSHTFINCIAYSGGATAIGFNVSINGGTFINCTAYNNQYGWQFNTTGNAHLLINCVSTGNSAYQFHQVTAGEKGVKMINCAAKADGSGTHDLEAAELIGFITLTADPFTNAAAGDFSLNSTSGGGLSLRNAGIPGVFPAGLSTAYLSIGAVQPQVGTMMIPMFGMSSPYFKAKDD